MYRRWEASGVAILGGKIKKADPLVCERSSVEKIARVEGKIIVPSMKRGANQGGIVGDSHLYYAILSPTEVPV